MIGACNGEMKEGEQEVEQEVESETLERRWRMRGSNRHEVEVVFFCSVMLKIVVPAPALPGVDYESKMAKLYGIYIVFDTSPPYPVFGFWFSSSFHSRFRFTVSSASFFLDISAMAAPNYVTLLN